MIICPSCNVQQDHLVFKCECGFSSVKDEDGIVSFLGASVLDPVSTDADYLQNYDQIANKDLNQSVLSETYVKGMAYKLSRMIKISKATKYCDLGVGKGYLIQNLLDRGLNEAVGIDISKVYLKKIVTETRVSCLQADAENIPFENHFDVVTATDIMEHVINVGSFLISLNRCLKLNGVVLLRVPYRENILQYSPHFGCPYRFVHLRTFNKNLLIDLLNDAGFEVVRYRYDGFSVYAASRLINKLGFIGKAVHVLYIKIFSLIFRDLVHINVLPSWICGIFMKPAEIIIEAKKKNNIIDKRSEYDWS